MISEATKRQLEDLAKNEATYRPAPAVLRAVTDKTIILLVGATCEGKSTLMHEVSRLHKDFGLVGTFTTRPARSTDGAHYTYYEYSDEGLAPLITKAQTGQLVQYAINFNLQMYGSEADDYPYTYNLLDVFSSAVSSFGRLGFKHAHVITVISRPDVWLKRFNERFPLGHEQRRARRDEAIESFGWSLSQSAGHNWIQNIDERPEAGAQAIIDLVLHGGLGNPAGREWCLQSLELAGKIEA
jgi:hypothetical protein